MYYPFSIVQVMRFGLRKEPEVMAVTAEELEDARQFGRGMLARFEADRSFLIRNEVLSVLMGATIPLFGYLLLRWPIWLIGLSILAETISLWIADRLRRVRHRDRVRQALWMAVRTELTLGRVRAVLDARSEGARSPWYHSPDMDIADWETSVVVIPCGALLVLATWAVPQVGWMPVAAAILGGGASHLAGLVDPQRRRQTGVVEAVDIRFLPRWPEAVYRVSIVIFAGIVIYQAAGLLPPDFARWVDLTMLVTYILVCLGLTARWQRSMRAAQRDMARFLSEDPGRLVYRLKSTIERLSSTRR